MSNLSNSDQPVTLTTTTPHQQLIIKTITLDHGLLRCVPDRRGESRSMYDAGASEDRSSYVLGRGMQALGLGKTEYVDLQPDGNSFDLMSGLIKRKV
jgi:biotin--protein ligase